MVTTNSQVAGAHAADGGLTSSLRRRIRPYLLCGIMAGYGAAFAADGHDHDHGKAPGQGKASGPVRELPLPEDHASAQSIAIDPAGRIWFSEKVGKKLAMYDPEKKTFSSYPLPASWGSVGFSQITAGPDGVIWFTVNRWAEGSDEPHMLGRFTPADGYFTKFAVPNKAIPQELMVDGAGVLWFFAANKNHLYRIDPRSFSLKGYPIPTANGHPRSLAAAQNGHIWFVEANTNKIGEFIPERETFKEYDVLTSFSNPGKISIDKQGRIWFVQVTANRLGVFTPEKNRFDEMIVPTPGSAPVALASDDRGNIWFLQYKGNKVGVLNPESAVFREYEIPTYGSLPAEMVLDRGRSMLWFTQSATDAKRLGMLSIDEALASSGGQDATSPGMQTAQRPDEPAAKWPVFLAILIALLILGGWRARSVLRRRQSQAG
jgi:virginiamycin B lyase